MNSKYISLFAVMFAFMACTDSNEIEEQEEVKVALKAGSADFSKYIAVGASFTAGFTDNALFIAGQNNSFPNILSQKFAMLNGGTFKQPLMNDNYGGMLFGGNQILNPRLYFNGAGPASLTAKPTTELTQRPVGPFGNLGVPGAKSFHFVAAGYGNTAGVAAGLANPYFARMSTSATTTILADAIAQNPTFFTLSEIGGNDVLSYATSGGTGKNQLGNLNPATYGSTDITDPNVFGQVLTTIVDGLTSKGAKGALATLPYITSLPHFTTVPYNPVVLDATKAAAVNQGFAAYNGGLDQAFAALSGTGLFTQAELDKRKINFAEGKNAVVIVDEYLTDLGAINAAFSALPKYRQATVADLLVLPSSSFIGTLVNSNAQLINGVTVPLEDKWVLTPQEQANIKTATDAYNTSIESIATSKGLALVDFKSILVQASTTGIVFDNYTMTTSLVFGGLVSLDGIHLTSRGYALMANKFMESIDAKYGSNFKAAGVLAKASVYPTNFSATLK